MKIEKTKISIIKFFEDSDHVRWSILFGVTIFFTILLYPNLVIKKHYYKLGDVAARDIKATKDFLIEDKDATETSRKQAVEKVLTVYDHDATLSVKTSQNVTRAFDDIRTVFEAYKNQKKLAPKKAETASTGTAKNKTSVHDLIWQKKADFEGTIGISVSDGAYKILEKEAFSQNIATLITSILKEIFNNGVVTNKELLLRETDKGIILRNISTKKEQVVDKLKHFYGLDQAKTMVGIVVQPLLKKIKYTIRNMIVDFSQRLIQPNITLNRSETEERKKRADAEIKPVFHKIKAGEMLLREGERVTKVQLLKLKAYQEGMKNEQILASCIGSALIILCILMTTYILYIHQKSRTDLTNNKNLLFIASILVAFFFIARISVSWAESMAHITPLPISASSISYGIPLAAGAMITCLFIGLELAIPVAMLIAIGTAIIWRHTGCKIAGNVKCSLRPV